MPSVFFNTETGQSDSLDKGSASLLRTATVYIQMQKHCTHMYRECPDALKICLAKDICGFDFSFGDCFRSLSKDDQQKVKVMIHGLNRSTLLEPHVFHTIEEWYVDQMDAHSPLMEYAVKDKGLLLTIAVTENWKHSFFTFSRHSDSRLPNLWGQEELSDIKQWLEDWYRNYNSPLKEFSRRCDDVVLCSNALPEKDFSGQLWHNIIEHFVRARERAYAEDDSLIKNLSPHTTKYGRLYELRLHTDGIRVLFALREGQPVVGGYYFYGTGMKKIRRNDNKTAVTRINAYNW